MNLDFITLAFGLPALAGKLKPASMKPMPHPMVIFNMRAILVSMTLTLAAAPGLLAGNWPQWRGSNGNGLSAEKNLPMKWSTNENVRWRAPLPERGNSSPVVWGDRVFVTQAVGGENRRTIMCFDRKTGKLLWQSGVTYTEREQTQRDNPYCAATPV